MARFAPVIDVAVGVPACTCCVADSVAELLLMFGKFRDESNSIIAAQDLTRSEAVSQAITKKMSAQVIKHVT